MSTTSGPAKGTRKHKGKTSALTDEFLNELTADPEPITLKKKGSAVGSAVASQHSRTRSAHSGKAQATAQAKTKKKKSDEEEDDDEDDDSDVLPSDSISMAHRPESKANKAVPTPSKSSSAEDPLPSWQPKTVAAWRRRVAMIGGHPWPNEALTAVALDWAFLEKPKRFKNKTVGLTIDLLKDDEDGFGAELEKLRSFVEDGVCPAGFVAPAASAIAAELLMLHKIDRNAVDFVKPPSESRYRADIHLLACRKERFEDVFLSTEAGPTDFVPVSRAMSHPITFNTDSARPPLEQGERPFTKPSREMPPRHDASPPRQLQEQHVHPDITYVVGRLPNGKDPVQCFGCGGFGHGKPVCPTQPGYTTYSVIGDRPGPQTWSFSFAGQVNPVIRAESSHARGRGDIRGGSGGGGGGNRDQRYGNREHPRYGNRAFEGVDLYGPYGQHPDRDFPDLAGGSRGGGRGVGSGLAATSARGGGGGGGGPDDTAPVHE